MALFGKKTKDTPAPSDSGAAPASTGGTTTTEEKKRGFGLGRKKDTATTPAAPAPGTDADANPDEFFDFSEEALTGATATNGAAAHATTDAARTKKKTVKPKGLKSGTVVGLNIGADSIKAIELRVKGTEIAITGMGMLPTPEDSIANGVVMSVASLSHAIRDVLQQAGIKSKRVVTSVAGTGALVVRVIEVPKMSDNELEDNMKVDADRYIPFPPSEVIMDFKALRDLPSDPDAPNMEVLLAAAQREIIDLHVQVLEGAKLDPRSIDVEPLAAVRALTAREINPNAAGSDTIDGTDYVDYNDVSAIVNIGASSTEISIVRGDILVFTRNVPTGGQTLTQEIVDYFGLHWPDAEHAKRQWGDALPHPASPQAQAGYGTAAAPGTADIEPADDWSEFGLDESVFDTGQTGFDAQPATDASAAGASAAGASATSAPATGGSVTGAPATGAFGADPFAAVDTTSGTTTPATTGGAGAQSVDPFDLDFNAGPQNAGEQQQEADPFDLDFFSQGPQDTQNKEPGEQHGQKEDEKSDDADKSGPVFDFSGFSFDDEEPPSTQAGGAATGDDEAELPTRRNAGDGTGIDIEDDEDWVLPTSAPEQPAPVPSAFDFPTTGAVFSADEDEDELVLPTATGQPGSSTTTGGTAAYDITEGIEEDEDTTLPTVVHSISETPAAGSTSAGVSSPFTFSDLDHTPTPPAADAATTVPGVPDTADVQVPAAAPEPEPAPEEEDDFDINSLFDEPSTVAPADTATAPTPEEAAAIGVMGAGAAMGEAGTAPASEIPTDTGDFGGFDDALQSFGAGLTDTGLAGGIDEQALYGVLNPILEGLVGEVRRSLEYHATRYPDAAVQHITLIGGGAKLKNIDAYFAQSLGIPTVVGNPLAGVKVQAPKLPPDYAADMGPLFVVALGLALRDLVR